MSTNVQDRGREITLLDLIPQDGEKRPRTVAEQYADFIRVNGWVVDEVAERARKAKRHGIHRYGVRAILEPLRWRHVVELGEDQSGWKLNNNVMSRLARDVMERYPDLDGFFETRELRAQ